MTASFARHRVFLVRHGQSQANAGGMTLANPVVPLTELGERQARALAPLLPQRAAGIWSSPFKRALDTAAPLTLGGGPCAEREAAVARFWLESDPDHRSGPHAETFREFHTRVARVREQFLPALPDGAVVFGHGMWMALLCWQLLGFEQVDCLGMTHFRRFQLGLPTPNTVVYGLTHVVPGSWEVKVEEAAMRAIATIDEDDNRAQSARRRHG